MHVTAPTTSADIAAVDAIRVGERDRTDLGDLTELAESITAVGLLHPVVVTDNLDLVAGGRRLAAVKQLGWTEVPVTVVDWFTADQALRAEADENTCRMPLSPIEASRARERRIRVLTEASIIRKPGRPAKVEEPTEGQGQIWEEPTSAPENPAKLAAFRKGPTAGEARKVGAQTTGYSGSSIDKVDEIREAAERGTVTVGTGEKRREVELPEPVREVARQKVVELAQPGAPIHPAHVEVRKAIDGYLADDPEMKRLTLRRNFFAAQSKAADITTFDPEHVAYAMEKDAEWEQLDRLQQQITEWFDKLRAARPRGLRVVGGAE